VVGYEGVFYLISCHPKLSISLQDCKASNK